MAATKKFPNLIHVTVEGEGDDQYYQVNEDGVFAVDEPNKPIAIYKLVELGRVQIEKRFVASGRKKRTR